jgi:hypothetical protein
VEGKRLTLTPMKDRNDFRKEVLAAGPLEKKD